MSGYDRRLGPCSEYCAVVDECEARGGVIQELRAENERLREALRPFADAADFFLDGQKDAEFTLDNFRAAKAALGETDD